MSIVSDRFSDRNNELWATNLVILSAILYGFLGYFGATLINLDLTISAMLFWRFTVATIWILIGLMWKNGIESFKAMDSHLVVKFLFQSSISYAGSSAFYFMASKLTGTGIAMVIFFVYPIFVVLMMMMKERYLIDKNTLISLIIILTGLLLLRGTNADHLVSKLGIIFAIVSAFSYAYYVYISKDVSNELPTTVLTLIVCLGNAILFLIFSLYTDSFIFPSTFKMWIYVCAIGIIATALPIQLMLEGLKIISASKASILSVLEPVVTLFIGMLLLKESVTYIQMLGASIILSSAVYIQFSKQKN